MNEFFKTISNDKIALWTLIASIVVFTITLLLLLLFFRSLPPLLPIYNKLAWGYARLGRKGEIFIPIGITFSFVITNSIIGSVIQKKYPLLTRLLFIANFIICLVTSIYVLRIVQVIL